ncbi:EAL domain-containing protein [Clostridium sp. WILCCON 0269]|uniref:EAL domain-containing protein n=1 Tax=Candidatus Clostridium eludens TaxID=3381663 RepID=A0ABW8SJ18_9CLOT
MIEYDGFNEVSIIREVIDNKRILVKYQPIVSLVKKKIVAFEALSRGINILNSEIIPPLKMFEYARNNGLSTILDRLCREKCIENFENVYNMNDEWYLFINVDASVIEEAEGSNHLFNQVLENRVSPKNIVIEINESRASNLSALERFTNNYRKKGFLIALDDVGTGFSNMDRVSIIKPDIIKLDSLLVRNIQDSYHKQEIFKCIAGLANRIGAVVVAEGIETEIELNYVIEFGAHLIQGYFFSKPEFINGSVIKRVNAKIQSAALSYKEYVILRGKENRLYKYKINKFLNNFIGELKINPISRFDKFISMFINRYKDLDIECAYILDEAGIQITNTIFAKEKNSIQREGIVFSPAIKGEDNSLKRYYYELMNSKMHSYFSEPYISYATGEICITLSRIFTHNNYKKYILCVDITRS